MLLQCGKWQTLPFPSWTILVEDFLSALMYKRQDAL